MLVFGATLFVSASLLFSIQPLIGKLLLPKLGGAPSVWNTVMVFFQVMLLAGYAYAHFSFERLGFRRQPWLHFVLLAAAAISLPFDLGGARPAGDSSLPPVLWVLLELTRAIGLPVFVLASTAPLLQKWFATSNDPSARDPYFLYAASNLGSFGALFAYPLLVEAYIRLQTQTRLWTAGYWIMVGMIAVCAAMAARRGASRAETVHARVEPVSRVVRWKWIALSFIPSSLMLGVTNYITTDVASVPLLWVLPLGIYLFTFVIAFGNGSGRLDVGSSRAVPIAALAVVFPMLVQATEPVWVLVLLHLFFFLFATLQIHVKLAKSRPGPEQLTSFYLYLSLGGVLGGLFNVLVAPKLFPGIIEYPLMILIATFIAFPARGTPGRRATLPPIGGGALVIVVMTIGAALVTWAAVKGVILANVLAGLFLVGSYCFLRSPVRYVLAIGTLLVCAAIFRQAQTPVIHRERNFFGVLRVVEDRSKPVRKLYHGTTIHGAQSLLPERQCHPLSYYHPEGPVGEITRLFREIPSARNVGLVGLGAGAMVSYSTPGEHWSLFEIDPAVVRIARDTNYFTYLANCATAPFTVHIGDARLELEALPDRHFGLLYVDAFSSDVIPMHLLTVEAFELYVRKLADQGILALHLSSRNFDLEPLVANIGHRVGLRCYLSMRGELSDRAIEEGGFESVWVILVADDVASRFTPATPWKLIPRDANGPIWTDDFSSLLGVLKF